MIMRQISDIKKFSQNMNIALQSRANQALIVN